MDTYTGAGVAHKVSLVPGEGEGKAIERVPGPPPPSELSQDPSLHHPFSGFS